jgi:hypothetical protein
LRRKGFEEADYRSDPDVLAKEIVDDLEPAEQFREIAADVGGEVTSAEKETE